MNKGDGGAGPSSWCTPAAAVALGSLLAGQRSSLLPEPWGRSLVGPGPVRSVPSLPVLWCGLLTGMPGSRPRLPPSPLPSKGPHLWGGSPFCLQHVTDALATGLSSADVAAGACGRAVVQAEGPGR